MYRYGDALDEALTHGQVDIVLSLVEELAARDGLAAAIRSRTPASLIQLLLMLNKNVEHPGHAATVLQVVNCVLDLHLETVAGSAALVDLLHDLKGRIGAEIKVQEELTELSGQVAMLLV